MRVALVVCVLAGTANADDAKQLFDEGKQLAAHASYREACEKFGKSYDLDPALGTMLNFADCEEHLGHLARAWQLFEAGAERADHDRDAVRAQYARDRAASLVVRTGEVVVKIADRGLDRIVLTIAGRRVSAGAEVHERVDPGDVEVVANAPERRFATTAHVAAGKSNVVEVPVLAFAGAEPERRRSWKIAAASLGGAGLASGVFSAVLITLAVRRYDQAFSSGQCGAVGCTPEGTREVNNARDTADLSTVFFVGAAALAAAGVTVWFLAPKDGSVEIAPTAKGNDVGVALRARF